MGRRRWGVGVSVRNAVVDEFYVTARNQQIRLQRNNIGDPRPLILINWVGAAIAM
jgi:hypothetical protein